MAKQPPRRSRGRPRKPAAPSKPSPRFMRQVQLLLAGRSSRRAAREAKLARADGAGRLENRTDDPQICFCDGFHLAGRGKRCRLGADCGAVAAAAEGIPVRPAAPNRMGYPGADTHKEVRR
jgi:hypothetical protein